MNSNRFTLRRSAQCLQCQHMLPFDAKEGMRYVCMLYGKRITEEQDNCKGFVKPINK